MLKLCTNSQTLNIHLNPWVLSPHDIVSTVFIQYLQVAEIKRISFSLL